MAICAHCKKPTESRDLQLIKRGNHLFYGCERCSKFFSSLDKVMEESAELLERLGSDYDENNVPYWEKSIDNSHDNLI
jgi:DNA-directed RNA polymerase subunit RPC12/RpoP